MIDSFFSINQKGSTLGREILAGLTTFMTMAYILPVNAVILSATGMPFEQVVAATALGAAIPCLLMGLWAGLPIALASGMGLNAALVVEALRPEMEWRTMMGVVVVEGVLITILVLTRCRESIMNAIPRDIKRAISVGIGLFIAFLGLQQMGLVTQGEGVLLTHGDLGNREVLLALAGLFLIVFLWVFKVPGALLLGVLATSLLCLISDVWLQPETELVQLPNQWMTLPDLSLFGEADILAALRPALVGVIFAFLVTDFFDTMGTVIALGEKAGFIDQDGRVFRLNRILLVDSLAAAWGGLCGASSVTTYIESASGISAGGKTGLVSVVVAFLFLAALFFAPVFSSIPAIATAPVLLMVGFLMMGFIRHIAFDDLEEGLPAFLVIILIPLTQSISFGIGMGLITSVLLKGMKGKFKEVSPWLYGVASVFLVSFCLG